MREAAFILQPKPAALQWPVVHHAMLTGALLCILFIPLSATAQVSRLDQRLEQAAQQRRGLLKALVQATGLRGGGEGDEKNTEERAGKHRVMNDWPLQGGRFRLQDERDLSHAPTYISDVPL